MSVKRCSSLRFNRAGLGGAALTLFQLISNPALQAQTTGNTQPPAVSPIQHVIIIVGEEAGGSLDQRDHLDSRRAEQLRLIGDIFVERGGEGRGAIIAAHHSPVMCL